MRLLSVMWLSVREGAGGGNKGMKFEGRSTFHMHQQHMGLHVKFHDILHQWVEYVRTRWACQKRQFLSVMTHLDGSRPNNKSTSHLAPRLGSHVANEISGCININVPYAMGNQMEYKQLLMKSKTDSGSCVQIQTFTQSSGRVVITVCLLLLGFFSQSVLMHKKQLWDKDFGSDYYFSFWL